MNPKRTRIRFPLTEPVADLEPVIATFHRFIQRGLVEGLILDVADYRHVPSGPGVLLVGHDVDYGVEPGAFTVLRKRTADPVGTQLRDLLRMGLGALEAITEHGELTVAADTTTVDVAVLDRLLGPAEEVSGPLLAEVRGVATELYGEDAEVVVVATDDPRAVPTVRISAAADAGKRVLGKLGGAAAPGQSAWDVAVDELVRLRERDADFVLLDVREPHELEIATLGGTHIPLAELPGRLAELDRATRVIVHCRAGHRGADAVAQLREAGFTEAWNLNGGLMAWADRVDPSIPRY